MRHFHSWHKLCVTVFILVWCFLALSAQDTTDTDTLPPADSETVVVEVPTAEPTAAPEMPDETASQAPIDVSPSASPDPVETSQPTAESTALIEPTETSDPTEEQPNPPNRRQSPYP